ncbi:G patch domain-containing protein-like protein [Zancudomyces culisetae]|uniref:G patch domain-containing protein-like protein n=1 Tax=Zancudomyces culisetae TaxID=1213189 RepID=A0A1R1PLU7_ZANCU|nr:G patch domain-containing protein-like protein [Zancudomyces culisetae]OMH85086.1 G patch domain-containing protein-like protein [Zancudomyces culisetae]|eukprot:OMH81951.1 G patch domain-containing protein-like protein [Zancudomyces culisetae]
MLRISKLGWTPSTFYSSRTNRAVIRQTRPEDFMDPEDMGETKKVTRVAPVKQSVSTVKLEALPGKSAAEKLAESMFGLSEDNVESGQQSESAVGYLILKALTKLKKELELRNEKALKHGVEYKLDQAGVNIGNKRKVDVMGRSDALGSRKAKEKRSKPKRKNLSFIEDEDGEEGEKMEDLPEFTMKPNKEATELVKNIDHNENVHSNVNTSKRIDAASIEVLAKQVNYVERTHCIDGNKPIAGFIIIGEQRVPAPKVFQMVDYGELKDISQEIKDLKAKLPKKRASGLKLVSKQEAERALLGYMPFKQDNEKHQRYVNYLKTIVDGGDVSLVCNLHDINEFYQAARIFKPMAEAMSKRFMTQEELEKSKLQESGGNVMENMAKADNYGTMTRTSSTWFPSALLCKRMNLSDPHHLKKNTHKDESTHESSSLAYRKRFSAKNTEIQNQPYLKKQLSSEKKPDSTKPTLYDTIFGENSDS